MLITYQRSWDKLHRHKAHYRTRWFYLFFFFYQREEFQGRSCPGFNCVSKEWREKRKRSEKQGNTVLMTLTVTHLVINRSSPPKALTGLEKSGNVRIKRSTMSQGAGTPIWSRWGCSSEILNLTPQRDHLGVDHAFCDSFWHLKETA